MLRAQALQHLVWLSALFQLSLALPRHVTTNYALTVIKNVTQPQTFENIATRHNGQLLLTSTVSPKVYQVDPFRQRAMKAIVDIPHTAGLFGIAELEEDVFYVISANQTGVQGVPDSNFVWKFDVRDRQTERAPISPSIVANVSNTQLMNGMSRLAGNDTTSLLISDSQAGRIYKLDVNTGSHQTISDDDLLKSSPTGLQIGVNGIHVRGSNLFFTNFNKRVFGRIPISLSTGFPIGRVEVIVNGVQGDDFAVSADGKTAWIALNSQSTLLEVDIPGKSARVVVESPYLESASSVSVGRTLFDRDRLYVSSAGPFNAASGTNTTITGGIVARVDLPKVK
ncbi:hypothetical protein N7536_007265 [Penicillium majusculum]|uniref:SMP-30/Gluconolactonase/LRE-like region domain-containing protein n=1 Tax=Penicillium solitum TaxID=60172 RepID=A0A1V6RKD4_9EURO|nr:uncharacterized protein PENSOL_c002G03552 [Penicillium solitum]KAJ5696853.1 hypothetical protein N7536_007265 [Penicillium majusculum]OQE02291.1 hypothetical protein PENSOL_c002G03552 [Penicillium solitum]